MATKPQMRVRTPEAAGIRKEKRDQRNKDARNAATVPKTAGEPTRDTRDTPSTNPDGEGPSKAGPTDEPIAGS